MKKSPNIGVDGLNFELILEAKDFKACLFEHSLFNKYNAVYANIKVLHDRLKVYINLPRCIRKDNVLPFSFYDMKQLEKIKKKIISELQAVIDEQNMSCDIKAIPVKSIEYNITQQVANGTTCGQMLNMFNRFFYDGRNLVYQDPLPECKFLKDNVAVLPLVKRKNYYTIKLYNKSVEQADKGNMAVENDLLRFEIVFVDRTLKRLCGNDLSLDNFLSSEIIYKAIEEFKYVFVKRMVKDFKICLDEIVEIIFQSLMATNSALVTVATYRELIVDKEILRRAMIKWYKENGCSHYRARRNTSKFLSVNKRLNLPMNAIDTMRVFKRECMW